MIPSAIVLCFLAQTPELSEIVHRAAEVLRLDWEADPNYAYTETDTVRKNGRETSHSYRVLMIEGSSYNLPVSPGEADLRKLKQEVERRKAETQDARRQRLANYQRQREENTALLLAFPTAFRYELLGDDAADGHAAYLLSASPLKRTGPLSRALKVLYGMRGRVWIDKEHFHIIRGECQVIAPIPMFGILARVMPGTQIQLEMAPVTEDVWLISRFNLSLTLAKLWMKSTQESESKFSGYCLNESMLRELLREPARNSGK